MGRHFKDMHIACFTLKKKKIPPRSWAAVAHTYNLTYLGDWDREDPGLKPAQAYSSQDLQITGPKWTEGEAQAVEYLLHKHKALCSNPNPTKTQISRKFNIHWWFSPGLYHCGHKMIIFQLHTLYTFTMWPSAFSCK
jgi:hypothetical protein